MPIFVFTGVNRGGSDLINNVLFLFYIVLFGELSLAEAGAILGVRFPQVPAEPGLVPLTLHGSCRVRLPPHRPNLEKFGSSGDPLLLRHPWLA